MTWHRHTYKIESLAAAVQRIAAGEEPLYVYCPICKLTPTSLCAEEPKEWGDTITITAPVTVNMDALGKLGVRVK
jgi:hypothetical protein